MFSVAVAQLLVVRPQASVLALALWLANGFGGSVLADGQPGMADVEFVC